MTTSPAALPVERVRLFAAHPFPPSLGKSSKHGQAAYPPTLGKSTGNNRKHRVFTGQGIHLFYTPDTFRGGLPVQPTQTGAGAGRVALAAPSAH